MQDMIELHRQISALGAEVKSLREQRVEATASIRVLSSIIASTSCSCTRLCSSSSFAAAAATTAGATTTASASNDLEALRAQVTELQRRFDAAIKSHALVSKASIQAPVNYNLLDLSEDLDTTAEPATQAASNSSSSTAAIPGATDSTEDSNNRPSYPTVIRHSRKRQRIGIPDHLHMRMLGSAMFYEDKTEDEMDQVFEDYANDNDWSGVSKIGFRRYYETVVRPDYLAKQRRRRERGEESLPAADEQLIEPSLPEACDLVEVANESVSIPEHQQHENDLPDEETSSEIEIANHEAPAQDSATSNEQEDLNTAYHDDIDIIRAPFPGHKLDLFHSFANADDPSVKRSVMITGVPRNTTLLDILDTVKSGMVLSSTRSNTIDMRTKPAFVANTFHIIFVQASSAAQFVETFDASQSQLTTTEKNIVMRACLLPHPSRPIAGSIRIAIVTEGATRKLLVRGWVAEWARNGLRDMLLHELAITVTRETRLAKDQVMLEFSSISQALYACQYLKETREADIEYHAEPHEEQEAAIQELSNSIRQH